MTCLKSRRPPFGGPRLACVVSLVRRGAGDGNRTRDNLLGRNKVTPKTDLIVNPSDSKIGVKPG